MTRYVCLAITSVLSTPQLPLPSLTAVLTAQLPTAACLTLHGIVEVLVDGYSGGETA